MKEKINKFKLDFNLILEVFIGEIAFVVFPVFIIMMVKLIYQDGTIEGFLSSSKLSFGLVVLQSVVLSKFITLKVIQKDFSIRLFGGIKMIILLLILSSIVLILVLIDEYQIINEVPKSRKIIFSFFNVGLFLSIVFELMVFLHQTNIERKKIKGYAELPKRPISRLRVYENEINKINKELHYLLRIIRDSEDFDLEDNYLKAKGFEVDHKFKNIGNQIDLCNEVLSEIKVKISNDQNEIKNCGELE